ncbi:hypothetical protein NNU90_002712 [Citrobacter farmeri]|nr:hypothetical protein [Citrobacter farmeri]
MTTKAAKAAAAVAAASDVIKPDEITLGNTVMGDEGQNTVTGSGNAGADLTSGDHGGISCLTGTEVKRKAVVFLGPYHRYSRGDTACFDAKYAEELVERRIAVWPEDARRSRAPKPGDNDFDTDIG